MAEGVPLADTRTLPTMNAFQNAWASIAAALFVALAALGGLPAQDDKAPVPAAPRVDVPTFPNPTCPIMGKKVSMPLFVDTTLGRFYVCCKPCIKKVLADLPTAHKTAYPVVQEWKNGKCPVSGEAVGEDAVPITLQGHRFSLCCGACAERARTDSQPTLAKVTSAEVVDVGNTTCPLTGKPVAANAFARIGDSIVRLSSPALLEEVAKAPEATLAKAREIAKAQPPAPPHVHEKSPKADPTPAPADRKG